MKQNEAEYSDNQEKQRLTKDKKGERM